MKRKTTGRYEVSALSGEAVKAFVPEPLPPKPPLEISSEIREKMNRALMALGRLDSVTLLLPGTELFIYTYIRKEAVLSSQIEGTQSSLSDLLLFEEDGAPGVPTDDVSEVSCYVAAMNHGLKRLDEGFPLSLRLIREMHEKLLVSGRGSSKDPGEFRRSQNWIGGSRPGNAAYVPSPPMLVPECMSAWEKFLHGEPEQTEILVKAALAHVQFETIHPFLDGNGRLGRLFITLLLCHEKVLKRPMLFLSLYFKTHRQQYYDLLQKTRLEGDWEAWLSFFADAVESTANKAVDTVHRLTELEKRDQQRIQGLGRVSKSALLVHRVFMEHPVRRVDALHGETKMVVNTINKVLKKLIEQKIIREVTGKKKNRVYAYTQYIDILSEGTEPIVGG